MNLRICNSQLLRLLTLPFLLATSLSLANSMQMPSSVRTEPIDTFLDLTATQRTTLDPIVLVHLDKIAAIQADGSLSYVQKLSRVHDEKVRLFDELRPNLTPEQIARLSSLMARLNPDGTVRKAEFFIPLLEVTYSEYFPTDSEARSIFGNAISAFSVGINDIEQERANPLRFSFGLDTLNFGGSNKLFVLSPQASLEYREPLAEHFSAFAKVSAGPAYMDYSFNTPAGNHLGAKRLGADTDAEIGVRYGRGQLAAEYRAFTQPAGINFNGFELSATYIVVRF